MIEDIDERKKSEEALAIAYKQLKNNQAQLIQSAKMDSMGQFASDIAHEINNPLSGVLNNVQLINMMAEQKKDLNIEDLRGILALIEESALRCTKITGSLLSFSRASKGVFQELLLNEEIEKVLALAEQELDLRNITIHKELSGLTKVK
jgi:histidine kinase